MLKSKLYLRIPPKVRSWATIRRFIKNCPAQFSMRHAESDLNPFIAASIPIFHNRPVVLDFNGFEGIYPSAGCSTHFAPFEL